MKSVLLRGSALLLCLLLAACSSGPPAVPGNYPPPVFPAERILPADYQDVAAVYDPWEPMNKRIYNFNYQFDRWIFLPVARAYETLLPGLARQGLHNFFENFRDIRTVANSLLQLNPGKFFESGGRVLVNSSVGLLGFIDVATHLDIPKPSEDFGQTLGYWGVGKGPYLVIPFMGPSSLRGALGLLPDAYLQTQLQDMLLNKPLRATTFLFDSVDTRAHTSFRYYETGSVFEYETVRWLIATKQDLDVAK